MNSYFHALKFSKINSVIGSTAVRIHMKVSESYQGIGLHKIIYIF